MREADSIVTLANFMSWCQSTHGDEVRAGRLSDERWRELAQEWDELRKPEDVKTVIVSWSRYVEAMRIVKEFWSSEDGRPRAGRVDFGDPRPVWQEYRDALNTCAIYSAQNGLDILFGAYENMIYEADQ